MKQRLLLFVRICGRWSEFFQLKIRGTWLKSIQFLCQRAREKNETDTRELLARSSDRLLQTRSKNWVFLSRFDIKTSIPDTSKDKSVYKIEKKLVSNPSILVSMDTVTYFVKWSEVKWCLSYEPPQLSPRPNSNADTRQQSFYLIGRVIIRFINWILFIKLISTLIY